MISKESYKKDRYEFSDLIDILKILRQPDGCPWDREQTHGSIRRDLLEEAYETADAIDRGSEKDMCEELGDLLLQVVFHSLIAEDENSFTFDDVADGICKKLILRHPHVFGTVHAENSEQVLEKWDAIKREEKHQSSYAETLESVPRAFPALMRAAKVQKRAARAGMDWENAEGAFAKLPEETGELEKAVKGGNVRDIEEEFGDLLFAAVNVARFYKIDAENALAKATDKFIRRFKAVEAEVVKSGRDMKELSAGQLDEVWNRVKKNER